METEIDNTFWAQVSSFHVLDSGWTQLNEILLLQKQLPTEKMILTISRTCNKT